MSPIVSPVPFFVLSFMNISPFVSVSITNFFPIIFSHFFAVGMSGVAWSVSILCISDSFAASIPANSFCVMFLFSLVVFSIVPMSLATFSVLSGIFGV